MAQAKQAQPAELRAPAGVPGRRGGGGRGAVHAWEQLAPGVHAWVHPVGEWGLSNAVLVQGRGTAALIDTQWDEPMTHWMLDCAPEHEPIQTLIYTHPDGDHIWGGAALGGLQEVLGSKALAEHFAEESPGRLALLARVASLPAKTPLLRAPGPLGLLSELQLLTRYVDVLLGGWEFGAVRAVAPTATFIGRAEREIGGRELVVHEAGPIHSASDSWVHLPGDGILVAGDLMFIGVIPVMWAGSCGAWVQALDAMLAVKPARVVPGHGRVGDASDLQTLRDHFSWLAERVDAGHRRGDRATAITESAIADARDRDLPWASWHGPERMHFSVVSELRHLAGGKPHVDHSARPKLMRQAATILDRIA